MTAEEIKKFSLDELVSLGEFDCSCGKKHSAGIKRAIIEHGALNLLPELLAEYGAKRPFIISGAKSFSAAGEKVKSILARADIANSEFIFQNSPVCPDEAAVGSALMHFDYACDIIVGIGSGVINDISKLLARALDRPYIIAATAPSMDGYASASSSMERDGLKVSLDSSAAEVIVGDLDILCQAPMELLRAGLGDMLAKYVSLCEWKLANIIVGEYYCPVVAALVGYALERCTAAAGGLVKREPAAVRAVMEGLIVTGMAMKFAGLSRPASGMEHYFSHIWDMRALAFEQARSELHGIQCGVGTLLSLKVYGYIRNIRPDREKALAYARGFSVDDWNRQLRGFIGPGAEAMIAAEKTEGKYSLEKHSSRLERILREWDGIVSEIGRLPPYEKVERLLLSIGAPASAECIGCEAEQLKNCLKMTKDIRDKYVASRLLWDLGVIDEAAEAIFRD